MTRNSDGDDDQDSDDGDGDHDYGGGCVDDDNDKGNFQATMLTQVLQNTIDFGVLVFCPWTSLIHLKINGSLYSYR